MEKRTIELENISGGKIYLNKSCIKGYETDGSGKPMSIFFGTGMCWSIQGTEENLKKLQSLNL